jgi:aryl-phospho-beta-D-glucosidase BglC (GH1 family)
VFVFQLLAAVTIIAQAQSTAFLGRGATMEGKSLTEKDMADFAATGANLVRFQYDSGPVQKNLALPYVINEANFAILSRNLDWCKKYHLNCVIVAIHVPGLGKPITSDDPLWNDPRYSDLAVSMWSQLAQRLAHRGSEIAGYDLMNEPIVPASARRGSAGDWNAVVGRMIAAIRASDTTHPIIVEAPDAMEFGRLVVDRSGSFKSYFAAPPQPGLIYSLHFYAPMIFTFGKNGPFQYPGIINGRMWNEQTIAQELAPVAAFQRKYHVQIYLGEFSCARWGGDACNRWVKDVITYAESQHWSWTYHVWRGADIWDAEKSNYDQNDHQRYASTPRLKILESYWKLGAQQ